MKKYLFSLMTTLLLAFVGAARADEVTIGDLESAGNNSYLPMNSLYDYSYTQQIYTAEEIGMAGTINSITMWLYGNANLFEMPFDIYMLEVDKETFDGNTDWVTVSQADMVYSGSVTVHNTTAEPYTFDLNVPFAYSGEGNLLIAFNNTTGQWKSGLNGKVFSASDNLVRAIYARRDGTIYDPYDPTFTATSTTYLRNVVVIDIDEASTCDAPVNFMASEIRPHQVMLTWEGSTGDFNVEYRKASETTWTRYLTSCGWNCLMTGLDANTAYQARVQANCPDGTTSSWRTVSFVTREGCPALTGLHIVEGSLYANGVTMTWDAEEGEYFQYFMGIGILYDLTGINFGQEEMTNSPSWSNLDPDTDYTFIVRRWCNNIDQSEAVFLSFHTPVSCPAPYDLTIVEIADGNVTLQWTPGGDEEEWELVRTNDGGTIPNITNNVYTIVGSVHNMVFEWAVRAVCGEDDYSELSNTITYEISDKLVIGSGTSTNQYLPTFNYYNYSLTQQLYTPEEIGVQGTIHSIDFYNAGTERTRNVDLYMVNTNKISFASNTDWITVSENDLVFSGVVTFTSGAWTSITLADEGFAYDGMSNLAVIMDDNTGTWESSMACRVFDAPSMSIRVYSDDTNYDPYEPSNYNGAVLNVKNQIRLDITGDPITFTYHTVTLSVDPEYSGYVAGDGTFLEGRECTISASPEYGYRFVNWTDANGNVVSTEPTYTFTLTDDVEFVAHFEALQAYEIVVLVNNDEYGYVQGGGLYYEGSVFYISAYPYSMHEFVNWTDENGNVLTEYPESYIQDTVTGPATFVANFIQQPTVLTITPNPIDLGPRPNGAWMRPVQFAIYNSGFPTTVENIEITSDYFVADQGNTTVPFTLDNWQIKEMTMSTNPEYTGTGAVSANIIVTYLQGEETATQTAEITATAYAPVAGDVWENPIIVNSFPYTNAVDAANAPYYNNYVMPFPNIPDGYDVVYKLTFEQDTYLNASIIADATGTIGENAKVALYPEDFKGLGGPDENNFYTNPMSAAPGQPFEAQIGDGTSTQNNAPFYTFYDNSLATMLYHANELEEAGVTTADMTSLSWCANNAPGYEQQGISIWMANVNDNEVTYDSPLSTDMTLVYTGRMTPEIGWNEFIFNEETFAWDGLSNVLILCQRNNGSWNSSVQWLSDATDFYSRSYSYRDYTPYDAQTTQYGMNISNLRPNIIMKADNLRAEIGGNREENELTVYDGTVTNNYVPAYIFYFDDFSKSQYIIPAEDLAEMDGGAISNLKFYTTSSNVPYTTVSNVDVYLMEVDYTSISAYEPKENGTIVYQGLLNIESVDDGGEMTINFNEPYVYNGGNLLVGIENTTDMGYKNIYFYGQTVSGASISGSNGSSPDSAPANQRNFIPKTTFTYTTGGNTIPEITDMTVVPGTYYLVASSTSENFTVSIETSELPCPEPATLIAPEDQIFLTNDNLNVTLKWKLDDLTTEYCLRIGEYPYNMETVVDWTRDLAERYTPSDLNYHTVYYWQVCVRNDGCPNGVAGPVWRFTTRLAPPTDLYSVTGDEIMVGDTLQLVWTAPIGTRGLVGYDVYECYFAEDGEYISNVIGSTTETHFETECPEYTGNYYFYWVSAIYDINLGMLYGSGSNGIYIYPMATEGVEGHVYEQDGTTGIANAYVTLWGYDLFGYYHDYTFTTDENGYFTGEMVLGNSYNAYAYAAGYQEAWYDGDITVTLDTVTPQYVDIIMKEVYLPVESVTAQYYPDANDFESTSVEVSWFKFDENWHTYCEYEFDNAWTSFDGATTWGYYYPAEVLALYMGYSLDIVSVFSDDMYNAVGGNYTCNIYEGGDTPAEGALVSTITVDVPQGQNAWVYYNLTTPVEITENTENLWVIWTANTSLGGYPAGCCSSNNDNGNWWYDYSEGYWRHQSGYCWTMRNHFSDGEGRSVVLGAPDMNPNMNNMSANNAPTRVATNGESASCINPNPTLVPLKTRSDNDRSMTGYRLYRTNYYNDEQLTEANAVLVADNLTATSYIDETFGDLPRGTYKYGVSCLYEGNRESVITWINQLYETPEESAKIISILGRNRDWSNVIIDESFEEGIPAGWNIIDADYDGHKWKPASELMVGNYSAHTGNDMICSESYSVTTGALYPDNYLVTPQVQLGGIFSFWACAQDNEYAAEHFGVAVSTYNNSYPYYFNIVEEWTLTSRGQGASTGITRSGSRTMGNWQQFTVDLSAYAGQWGYIAIRHFDCSGQFYLDVDDIKYSLPQGLQTDHESQIVWSNPIDRDMYLHNNVDITVTLNSGDSPEGTVVSFVNQDWNDQQAHLVADIVLDDSGYYAWEWFRKGEYEVTVTKEGYTTVTEYVSIYEPTALQYQLEEIMTVISDLYVSRTGWATWNGPGNDGFAMPSSNNNSFEFGFENDLEGWTNIDADGDGHIWYHSSEAGNHSTQAVASHNGSGHVMGESYCNAYGVLYPDNYLVSPQQYSIRNGSTLSFWACTQDVNYPAEHFGVAISTASNTNPYDFTTIAEWTITAKGGQPTKGGTGRDGAEGMREGSWYHFSCNLSAYAGQQVWIALRHFNCSDMFIVCVDDLTLSTGAKSGDRHLEAVQVVLSDLNGNVLYTGETENDYMQLPVESLVEGQTYHLAVGSVYSSGLSNWDEVDWVYEPCDNYEGATDLIGQTLENGVMLSWTYPEIEEEGERFGEWHYYDNGENVESIGTGGGQFWWGVMFPAGSYSANSITKVSAYDYMAMNGTVTIYNNDDNYMPSNEVGSMDVTFTGSSDFVEFTFNNPVSIDVTKNVWVVFCNNSGATYPAAVCYNTGDPNGRWVSTDGYSWGDLADYGLDYTFMVRAYFENTSGLRAMILRDGEWVGFTSSDSWLDAGATNTHEYEIRVAYPGTAVCPDENFYLAMSCPQPVEVMGPIVTQTTYFAEGWTWWSTYVNQERIDGLALLEEGLGDNGMQIKSQTQFVQNMGEMWVGALNDIDNESTYMVQVSAPCTVSLTTEVVNPEEHPITLNEGWNWVGYPSATAMSVSNALADYEPADGDFLKSQTSCATYYSALGWIGSLKTLTPGMGLMYKSNSDEIVTFTYAGSDRAAEVEDNITAKGNRWEPNVQAYPNNMSVLAVVELDDNELRSESYELAAFANGECRGSAKLMFVESLNRYIAFLTVYGEGAAELNFGLYDAETGMETFDSDEILSFVTNAIVGNPMEPYVVSFRGMTGMNEQEARVNVFPNPVEKGSTFSLDLPVNANKVQVEIVNALGVVVETVYTPTVQDMKAPDVAGVYTLRITVEGQRTYIRKLIVR